MKLTVLERLRLFEIVPREGDFATLKTVRTLREAISISEAEAKEFAFKATPNESGTQYAWNNKGMEEREVEIGGPAVAIVAEALKKMNTDKKLTDDFFSLYEKFVGEG